MSGATDGSHTPGRRVLWAIFLLSATFTVFVALAVAACGSRSALGVYPSPDALFDDRIDEDATVDASDSALDQEIDGSLDGIVLGCGFTTCTNGCCRTDGECVLLVADAGLDFDYNICGWYGEPCEACDTEAGYICKGSTCFRYYGGCANCPGCCWDDRFCASGIHDRACGANGEHCSLCVPQNGESCTPLPDGGGACKSVAPCSIATCKGCCAGDICAVGTQNFACGTGGVKCTDCVFWDKKCSAGACVK